MIRVVGVAIGVWMAKCGIVLLRLCMQVKPKGAAFVSRALESVLRKFPVEGSRMLHDGGVLGQVP